MNQIFITVTIVIGHATLTKAFNSTNSTNSSLQTNNTSNNTTPLTKLYVGAFFDLTEKDGYGALPMAVQAIEEINNNPSVLPGYQLELVVKSTQGSFGIGQKAFNEFLNTGPTKIMLLGPGEDSLAKSIAAYSGIADINLLQFSYGTSDLELENRRDLYPNFFRTKTSPTSLNLPRKEFIKEYGWDEVGIIYGDSERYFQLSNQLAGQLKRSNIKVLAEVRLQANDPTRAIRTMKDRGIHVILGMFSLDSTARKMFCEAHRARMYGPHYVWILTDSKNNNWWIPKKGENIACSELEMKCQIQNHFSFYHTNVVSLQKTFYSFANKNKSQIIEDYRARVDNFNDTSNRSNAYLNVYDALWSIAFVLSKSRSEIERQGKTLENLTYGDANVTNVFRKEAVKLKIPSPNIGTSVRYYSNGNRRNGIVIKQIVIKDGIFKTINGGTYNVENDIFTASTEIHWFAGTPYTKTTETYIYRTIDETLFFLLIAFASLGIVYGLLCLLTLALNFKKKLVQNSGPVISLLIILGCLLSYVTVILYGFDYARVSPDIVTRLCRARSWTFTIGFTLSVGGLTAKLWMAYGVVKERFVRSRKVMMFWMLGILVLLLVIDITILGCWETKDPLYRILKQVRSQPEYECFQPITADTFRAKIEVVEQCNCADLTLWLVVILTFKALLVIVGGFLAWQTRKLYIPALNDTQHCVSCMFVIVVFCVVGVIVAFTTTLYPSVYYGVIGGLVIFATTLILVLLFTNKIARLCCIRTGSKTTVAGQSTEYDTTCACGAACAKFCSCCACSSACCISFWSCFPCCNLFTCLRSFFCGSRVHSSSGNRKESEKDFYIGGQLQDKDAEIVYLKNELRERDTMLSNLQQMRTVKSIASQTHDDGSNFLDHGDDAYDSTLDASGSDAESLPSNDGRKHFRRAANKIRIFNEAADYSHVRSKVNTGLRSSLAPNTPQERRGSRMSISSQSNEEIRKLKTSIAEKDDEINTLKKELEALRKQGSKGKYLQTKSTPEQKSGENFQRTQRILLVETPATPIHEDKTIFTFPVQSLRSTSPSTVPPAGSSSSSTIKPLVTPGPSIVKPSMPPSFPTIKSSVTSSPSPGKSLASKSPSAAKSSGSPSPNATKSAVSISAVESSDSRTTSSTSPAPSSKHNDIDENVSTNGVDSTSEKPSDKPETETETQYRKNKKNSVGAGGAWLFDDHSEPTVPEKNTNNDHSKGSADSAAISGNKPTARRANVSPIDENGPDDDLKASLTNVSISVPQNDESAPEKTANDTTKELKSTDKEERNRKGDDKNINDHDNGNGKNNNNQGQSSENAIPKDELAKDASSAAEKNEPENAEVKEDESRRTIEMIDEEEDDEEDGDEYEDEGEEDDDDADEDNEVAGTTGRAAGDRNGARKSKKRRRRKKLGYGKLKWNAVSKVDTGSVTRAYAPRKSIKKIPQFKNDYSHVRSRISSVSEGSTGEKVTDSPNAKPKQSENEEKKTNRSQSLYRPPPEYIKVRPRLYNEGRRYSEMPRHSTMPYSVKESSR